MEAFESCPLTFGNLLFNHFHRSKHQKKFAAAMLLGLAFAATIGGMATPVGTPPNMYFFKAYKEAFPHLNDLNFLSIVGIYLIITSVFFKLGIFPLHS